MNGPIAFHVLVSASENDCETLLANFVFAAADGDPTAGLAARGACRVVAAVGAPALLFHLFRADREEEFPLPPCDVPARQTAPLTKLRNSRLAQELRDVSDPVLFPFPGRATESLLFAEVLVSRPCFRLPEAARAVGANVEAVHFISGERDSPLATILARVLPPDRLRVHFGGRPAGAASILEDVMQQVPCGTVVYFLRACLADAVRHEHLPRAEPSAGRLP